MIFRPLGKKKDTPLEEVMLRSAVFVLHRESPTARREEALLTTLRSYALECGPRMGPIVVFALFDELAPGLGKAARAYMEGLPATRGQWDGCLFDAGVPMTVGEALNPAPFASSL